MTDAVLDFAELELIDQLISGLEAMIAESDEKPLSIDHAQRPRRAYYRVLNITSPSERKIVTCEATYLDSERLSLRCNNTELVRLMSVEVMVQAEKSGRGETMAIVQGKVRELKRIRGGYDVDVDIVDMRKNRITPGQKLRECILKNDAAGWNRWCNDIKDTIELVGMDLRMADLSGYDLCCADFTGSDLSGANLGGAVLAGSVLTNTIMEKVSVTGADFFHARMNKAHAALVQQSGMPEVESVMFE